MKSRLSIAEPRWLLVVAFFFAGVFLGGMTLYLWLGTSSPTSLKIHPRRSSYRYINPLLAVDVQQNSNFAVNQTLEFVLKGLIAEAVKNEVISRASVYSRDLEPGLWAGINESERFSPGKLLKLPIMITYYKMAESNPQVLNETIVLKEAYSSGEELSGQKTSLTVGEAYTADELIRAMIVDSDDAAADVLFDHVNKDTLSEVFSDLGIDFEENKKTQDFISLKLYSLFFRVLYNATYLNRELSEKAMALLIEADNSVGIGAALPKGLDIANRVGARSYLENGTKLYEMYDCGITYYPSHPYLLCAVARGRNLDGLKYFFKDIGEKVYSDTRYRYPS